LKNRDLAALALRGGYVLVTRDHDFANTVLYSPKRFHGIVILHIHPPKAEKLIEGMERLLATVESYERKLIIVREDAIEVFEDADLAP
jgi:predicted nuclease of predicted toxin-antitoxin system